MPKDPDLDFDDDDLGLDDELAEFGDSDPDANPPKNKREAVTRSLKDIGKGAVESTVGDPLGSAAAIAKHAIPDSLSKEVSELSDVVTSVKDEYKKAVSEVKDSAKQTVRTLDSILPDKGIFRNVVDKLNKRLNSDEQSAVEREKSKEEVQTANIASAIEEVFGKQTRITQANDLIQASITNNNQRTNIQLLSSIAANTEYTRKFNFEIANSYYRRSLELQYKSLFVASEQLQILKSVASTTKNQLETVVHNTGLPDIVKIQQSELLGETLHSRMRDSVADLFYSNVNPLFNLKKNAIDKIQSFAGDLKEGLTTVDDIGQQYGMINEMSSGMGGKGYIAGRMIGDTLRNFGAKKLGERLSKTSKGQEAIYRVKDGMADVNSYFGSQADDIAKNGKRNENGELTLGNRFKEGIFNTLNYLSSGKDVNEVKFNNGNLEDPRIFDGRAHSSITKIIPGLLSKIYGEVKAIRTGNNPNDNEVYFDHKKNTFSTKAQIKADIKKDVSVRLNKNTSYYMESIITNLEQSSGKILTANEKNIFRKALIKYLVNGGGMNPSSLVSDKFLKHIEPKYKSKFKRYATMLLALAKKDPAMMDILVTNIRNIKAGLPGMANKLKDLHDSGLTDIASELGLAKLGDNGYEYNQGGMSDLLVDSLDNINDDDRASGVKYRSDLLAEDKVINMRERIKGIFALRKKVKLPVVTNMSNKIPTSLKDKYFASKEYAANKTLKYADWAKDKIDGISTEPIVTTYEKVKEEFFASPAYQKGLVTNINDYITALNYKVRDKDTITSATIGTKKVVNDTIVKAKEKLDTVSKAIETETPRSVDDLKDEFFNSKEYVTGTIRDFPTWVTAMGYNVAGKADNVFTKARNARKAFFNMFNKDNKSNNKYQAIGNMFRKTRELDRKIVTGAPGAMWSGVKSAGRGVMNTAGFAGDILGSIFGATNKTSGFFKKTRAIDKKVMGSIPGLLMGSLGLVGKGIGIGGKVAGSVLGGAAKTAGAMVGLDKVANVFDRDGDGKREGDWRDRLNLFKKKDKQAPTATTEQPKESNSLLGLLKPALGLIVPAIAKIASISSSIFGVIKKLPGLLSSMLPFLKTMATGIGGLISKGASALAGGVVASAGAVKTFVKDKVVPLATKAVQTVKVGFNKIKSVLNGGKTTIIRKFGKKASAKILATLAAKIAARAVPVAGAALIAYDSAMIIKDMKENNTPFKSAIFKQVLGFDPYAKDSVAKDENGNPIKPDENLTIKEKEEQEKKTSDSKENKDSNKTGESKEKDTPNIFSKSRDYLASKASAFMDGAKSMYNNAASTTSNIYNYGKNALNSAYNTTADAVRGVGNLLSGGSFSGKVSANKQEIINMLDNVAKKTGIDAGLLKSIAAIESDLNPNAGASTSSAKGLFQFVNGTWKQMINGAGKKYGYGPNTSVYDPEANATMGAEYLKDNIKILSKHGIPITPVEMYLMHFLGSGDGPKFLRAPDNAIGAQLLPKPAAANKGIFYHPNGQPRTIGEIYNLIAERIKKKAKSVGFVSNVDTKTTIPSNNTNLSTSTVPATLTKNNAPVNNTNYSPSDTNTTSAVKPTISNNTNNVSKAPPATVPVTNTKTTLSNNVKPVTTPAPAVVYDNAKLAIANTSNDTLVNIDSTLAKSLRVQMRMADALEKLVKADYGNKQLKPNKDNENVNVANAIKPTNNTTLPNPAMDLKRKTY